MDENHQDKTESKLIATKGIRWGVNRKSKLWVPKRRKRTGFEDKTLWDWMDLSVKIIGALVIPITIIVLIVNVNQFNTQQSANARMQATQVAASAAQSLDQQRQTILDTYLDRMSDLLLKENLRTNSDAQALAQARTYTALRNLDGTRKGTLVRFLWGAELINGQKPIISLSSADLSGVVFTDANLKEANLNGAILSGANLSKADLHGAYFIEANLSKADLLFTDLQDVHMDRADLSGAYVYWSALYQPTCHPRGGICSPRWEPAGDLLTAVRKANAESAHLFPHGLEGANLSGAPLEGADLSKADLQGTNLKNADLGYANLSGATLSGAKLIGASLDGANLSDTYLGENDQFGGANLDGANLSGADNLTQQQIDQVSSCNNAILPPGLTCHANQ